MCGIVGIASVRRVESRDWLTLGIDSLGHRGPDDRGEWWSPCVRVGLGHRRLAILDLSSAGHQPMRSHDGSLTIVFNGEIYNHQELRSELTGLGHCFVSKNDTEVLLAAIKEWGSNCLRRLNGMFAFAVFDSVRQELFLARDRAGEKPLFLRRDQGTLRFASELKGLLADRSLERRVDPEALDCYLSMGFVPGNRCILKSYSKLPAAHAAVFNLTSGDYREWCYWQLPEPDFAEGTWPAKEELLEELESLLEDSVRRQLVADVPVGILLSGGLDSSLITAMAARALQHVKTFTVCFPAHAQYDETRHARLISKHFRTEHIELAVQPANSDLVFKLATQFDEPLVDSSMIPTYLVCQLVKQHCSVALGGDGGDELFGGYEHYSRLSWIERRFGVVPMPIRRLVSRLSDTWLPIGFKGRNWLQSLGADLRYELPLIAQYFDGRARQGLMSSFGAWPTVSEADFSKRTASSNDLVQRATRTDFGNYLVDDILVKLDRASMLNSLEVRSPFLDHRIIEFAFAKVPSLLKVSRGHKKILLKEMSSHVLPPEFDRSRKQGFSIPLANWLKGGQIRDLFHSVLLDNRTTFDRSLVKSLLAGQNAGLSNGERLFGLVMFELWRREYDIDV